MKLKFIIWIIGLILILQTVTSLEECKKVTSLADIPCQVTSTWNYSTPCSQHTALFYNEYGNNTQNYTFENFGTSNLCKFQFNSSVVGTFTYKVTNGDSGNILIEGDKTMAIALVSIVVSIAFAFLIISFKVTDDFKDIKELSFFASIALFVGALTLGFPMLSSLPNEGSFRVLLTVILSVLLLVIVAIIYLYLGKRFEKVFDRLSGTR